MNTTARDRALAVATVLVGLVAAVAAVFALPEDPRMPIMADAGLAGARSLAIAALWTLSVLGAGRALVFRVDPDTSEGPGVWLHSASLGLVLWGGGGLVLGITGLLSTGPILGLGVLLAGGWLLAPRPKLPQVTPAVATLAGCALAFGLVQALAPAVDTDELYQHLAIPDRMLRAGGLVGGVLHPDGSRPMLLHLPLAMVLDTAGSSGVRALLALVGAGLVALTAQFADEHGESGAGLLAVLALMGSWSWLQELGLAANNLPTALLVLAAADAALRGRPVLLALSAGGALGIKYTAAGGLVGAGLAARLTWRQRIAVGVGAALLVSPWWLRNLAEGLNPLFPYAGWQSQADGAAVDTLRFVYLEKYGAGRDLLALAALPWNAVMTADTGSFRFLGRLSPVMLPFVAAAVLAGALRPKLRRLLVIAATGALAWATGPHWLRHLLPVLPILVSAGAAATLALAPASWRRPLWVILGTALLMGIPGNIFPAIDRAADRLPVATGHEAPDAFGPRHHVSWEAAAWARAHLPEHARVALFFDWSTSLIGRDTVLGSVEDHVPSRFWILTRGPRSLTALQDVGVTHVLVGRAGFLSSQYPFIEARRFQRELLGPIETLNELLLQQATLIHETRGTRIYRLEPQTDAFPLDTL